MVVKRVEIANFRGIARATLDLESQQTDTSALDSPDV